MGNCDLDISGFYWNVKKCYVRIDGSMDTWLARADEEYVVEGQKLKPHVSHTFYYSNNKYEDAGPFVPCFETEENEVVSSEVLTHSPTHSYSLTHSLTHSLRRYSLTHSLRRYRKTSGSASTGCGRPCPTTTRSSSTKAASSGPP